MQVPSLTIRNAVHPHVGGETRRVGAAHQLCLRSIPTWVGKPMDGVGASGWGSGPSPRGWGNHAATSDSFQSITVHPHVGGETRRHLDLPPPVFRSIPTWVGKPPLGWHWPLHGLRSIPTWVGETESSHRHMYQLCTVHPHVGGETS